MAHQIQVFILLQDVGKSVYNLGKLCRIFELRRGLYSAPNMTKENHCADLLMKPAKQDIHLKSILKCEIVRCIMQ